MPDNSIRKKKSRDLTVPSYREKLEKKKKSLADNFVFVLSKFVFRADTACSSYQSDVYIDASWMLRLTKKVVAFGGLCGFISQNCWYYFEPTLNIPSYEENDVKDLRRIVFWLIENMMINFGQTTLIVPSYEKDGRPRRIVKT